jgi:hypothetical protein
MMVILWALAFAAYALYCAITYSISGRRPVNCPLVNHWTRVEDLDTSTTSTPRHVNHLDTSTRQPPRHLDTSRRRSRPTLAPRRADLGDCFGAIFARG